VLKNYVLKNAKNVLKKTKRNCGKKSHLKKISPIGFCNRPHSLWGPTKSVSGPQTHPPYPYITKHCPKGNAFGTQRERASSIDLRQLTMIYPDHCSAVTGTFASCDNGHPIKQDRFCDSIPDRVLNSIQFCPKFRLKIWIVLTSSCLTKILIFNQPFDF